jgi:hypothetical protein
MRKTLKGNYLETQDSEEIARIKEENMKFIEKDIHDFERIRFLILHNCNPFPFNIGETLRQSKKQSEMKLAIQRSIKQ